VETSETRISVTNEPLLKEIEKSGRPLPKTGLLCEVISSIIKMPSHQL
jgi:hypothetical protein